MLNLIFSDRHIPFREPFIPSYKNKLSILSERELVVHNGQTDIRKKLNLSIIILPLFCKIIARASLKYRKEKQRDSTPYPNYPVMLTRKMRFF